MLTEERQNYILQCLRTQKIVKSQEIIARTKASESTVRRDLRELEHQGLLTRIHGGAKRIDSLLDEPSQMLKANTNLTEKHQIAQYAAKKVHPHDILYLDAGTTIQAMIPYLDPDLNLTIVTNGIDTASMLAETELKVILIGGQVKNLTKAVIGSKAIEQLSDYRFDIAFVGTNGIDLNYGYSTPDPEEAVLKRTILKQTANKYILADVSKFGHVAFDRFAQLNEAKIITSVVPNDFQALFQKTHIEEVNDR
ncbi:DeoR/GlpR family DNA-binding transcription regulator [Agrilactobacillus yilanensis]|uniref:DeoR/GlpR family DNA-binding transcription regulator n=1 Tax=Agrilactobacillus yilanensis TaxID=2485997 RepID=A0ABW4J7E7_9LACO|nr:DeoR/GlpR family DNA-binding transcription regulator [Agrilactobacillus yilanensis]